MAEENNNSTINEEVNNNSAGSKSGGAFGRLRGSSKNDSSPLDNIKAKAGSAAMQAMGVPKPLANIAANKLGNKKGNQSNVPESLKKRGNGMPSLGNSKRKESNNNGEKSTDSATSSRSGGLVSNALGGSSKTSQGAEGQEKSTVQKSGEEVAAKGSSAALQATGVPKPVADLIAKKFTSGPGLKIAIIGGIAVFFMWLIIIVIAIYILFMPLLKGMELIGDIREGTSGFFSSFNHWISGDGWCADDEECATKAEDKFYEKVVELADKYPLIDMPLVMSSVLYGANSENGIYGVGNTEYCVELYKNEQNPDIKAQKIAECESETATGTPGTEGYKEAKDNLSKVANKLSQGKDKYEEYMLEKFIPNNYSDIMKSSNLSAKQILDEIYTLSKMFDDFRNKTVAFSSGGICTYSVGGVDVSQIKVRLLNCSWNPSNKPSPIADEELVDFEKYILGVVYGEHAGAPAEALKTQAIAARSFSLVRPEKMGGSYDLKLEKENGQWILQLRNCTADHVYCDPDKGCWSDDSTAGDTVHSGYVAGKAWSKPPLAEDSEIRSAVSSVKGMVLVDGAGNIVSTAYTNTEQQKWSSWANEGKDYNEILKLEYKNGNSVISNCTAALDGDWATWRQFDSKWASVPLGGNTLGKVGCLVTSFAIQIARSGTAITLPAGVSEFNPGTFVQYSGIQFSPGGGYLGGDQWTKEMAPGFVRVGALSVSGNKQEKIAKIAEYVNQGYYIVPQVKYNGGTHFVAVVGTSSDDIIMADPASSSTELFAKYPSGASASVTLTGSIFKRTD